MNKEKKTYGIITLSEQLVPTNWKTKINDECIDLSKYAET